MRRVVVARSRCVGKSIKFGTWQILNNQKYITCPSVFGLYHAGSELFAIPACGGLSLAGITCSSTHRCSLATLAGCTELCPSAAVWQSSFGSQTLTWQPTTTHVNSYGYMNCEYDIHLMTTTSILSCILFWDVFQLVQSRLILSFL